MAKGTGGKRGLSGGKGGGKPIGKGGGNGFSKGGGAPFGKNDGPPRARRDRDDDQRQPFEGGVRPDRRRAPRDNDGPDGPREGGEIRRGRPFGAGGPGGPGGPRPQGDRPFRPGGPGRPGGFRRRDDDDAGGGEEDTAPARPQGPRPSGLYRPENAGPMRPLVNGGAPLPRPFGVGGPRQGGPAGGPPRPFSPGGPRPGPGGPGGPRPGPGGPRGMGPRPGGPPRRFDDRDEPEARPRRQGPVGDLLYGRNAVMEALRAGRDIKRVLVATGAHGEIITEIVDTARARKISLQSVDRRRLDDMAFNHQGVVAEAGPFVYATLEDVIEVVKGVESPLVLVLDVLQDPQNLGSLLRTAAAAGAQGVVIPEHRAVGVTPAVVKASAGAIERLKIAQVTNLSRAIDELKEAGMWAVGLDADGDTAYDKADLDRPLALVVGGEGKGLRPLVRQHCDVIVRLPMPGAIESLNAAVAGSIVLYEALRQRANRPAPVQES